MATETLAVVAVGTPNAWLLGAGASKVAAVTGPDDDHLSYISCGTVNNRVQRFRLAVPLTMGVKDPVTAVDVRARCVRGGAQNATFVVALVLDGLSVTGPTHTATATYATVTDRFLTRPGGGAWTMDHLRALDVQIQNTQGRDIRCSTLEGIVTYSDEQRQPTMAVDFLPLGNYAADTLVTGAAVEMPAGMRLAYVFMRAPSQGEWTVTPADYRATVVLQRSDNGGATWVDWDWETFEGGRMASDGTGRLPFLARGENEPLTAPVRLRCTFQQNQPRRMGLLGALSDVELS